MSEVTKPVKVRKSYRLKRYATPQLEFADLVEYKGNDIFLADQFYPLLNRWTLINEIRPTINLPIRYSTERKQFELLKQPIFTPAGELRTAVTGAGLRKVISYEGVAEAYWSDKLELPAIMASIRLISLDYPFITKVTPDDVLWFEDILCKGEDEVRVDISTKAIQVKRYRGSDASFRFEGYQ